MKITDILFFIFVFVQVMLFVYVIAMLIRWARSQ